MTETPERLNKAKARDGVRRGRRRLVSRYGPVVLTAILGILASFGLFRVSAQWDRRVAELEFRNLATSQLWTINKDLEEASSVLETAAAFFEASERPVSEAEFVRFAAALRERTAGLRDVGWAPRVNEPDRTAFTQAVRGTGNPDFLIKDIGPDGTRVPATANPEYYPILFTQSPSMTRIIQGFNLYGETERRSAAGRALATGRPAATLPLPLVTVPGRRSGVMAFTPVHWKAGAPGELIDTREGLIFGAFDIAAMIDNIVLSKRRLNGIDAYLFEPYAPAGDRLIHWRPERPGGPVPSEEQVRALPHWEGEIAIMDRRWGAILLPSHVAAAKWSWHTVSPLAAGLLLTAVIVATLLASIRRNNRLEMLTAVLRATTDELHENGRKISHMARHDALTGLPNRRVLADELSGAVTRAAAENRRCAVLQVDLDRFKPVNDVYGHAAGDTVLCEVARRLLAVTREADTVVRLGGDEFAIIMEYGTGGPDATATTMVANTGVESHGSDCDSPAGLAERIIAALRAPIEIEDATVRIGASIGIARSPDDGTAAAQLLHAADLAMYSAKRRGRGTFCEFDPSMDLELRRLAGSEATP